MRMLAVADVYEALTSDRPYRPAHSPEHALEMMRANVPGSIDREALSALERLPSDAYPRDARHVEGVLDRLSS
jgi:HD-GYP domain-containing protein (c-di-GMP phosphodiesterase class II)